MGEGADRRAGAAPSDNAPAARRRPPPLLSVPARTAQLNFPPPPTLPAGARETAGRPAEAARGEGRRKGHSRARPAQDGSGRWPTPCRRAVPEESGVEAGRSRGPAPRPALRPGPARGRPGAAAALTFTSPRPRRESHHFDPLLALAEDPPVSAYPGAEGRAAAPLPSLLPPNDAPSCSRESRPQPRGQPMRTERAEGGKGGGAGGEAEARRVGRLGQVRLAGRLRLRPRGFLQLDPG